MSKEYTGSVAMNGFLEISAKYLGLPSTRAGAGQVRVHGYSDNRMDCIRPVEIIRGKAGEWRA